MRLLICFRLQLGSSILRIVCLDLPHAKRSYRPSRLGDGGETEVAIFSGGDERRRAILCADREYGAFDEIALEPYQR
jgi:hypothetical protein